MATAFPGTSNVESNFSIVKWEKYVTQMSLSDFSLEGILHAKQYNTNLSPWKLAISVVICLIIVY